MTDRVEPHSEDENVPIDAEFEPAPRPNRIRASGHPKLLVGFFITLVSLVGLGFAAVYFGLVPGLNGSSDKLDALRTEISDLRSGFEQANAEREALTSQLAQSNTDLAEQTQTLQALNSRNDVALRAIANIETRLDDLQTSLTKLQATPRIDPGTGETVITRPDQQTLDRIDAIERAITQFPSESTATQADTLSLSEDIATLRMEIDALTLRTADTPAPMDPQLDPIATPETASIDAALALSAIEAAARRGQAFQIGYEQLANAIPGDPSLPKLAPLSRTGAPTLAQLKSEFPSLATRALDAEARAIGGSTGWMRAIFGDGVTVRQAGQDNAADPLEQAERHLADDNLKAAVDEIETLAPGVQSVFTDWLDNAHQRLSLEEALEALRLTMIAKDLP